MLAVTVRYSIDCANDLFSYSMNNDEEISFYVSRIFWVLVFSSYSNLATLNQIRYSSKNIGNLSHHTKSLFHQLEQFFIFLRRRTFTISGYVIVICQCLAIAFHSFMGKSKKKINRRNIQTYIYQLFFRVLIPLIFSHFSTLLMIFQILFINFVKLYTIIGVIFDPIYFYKSMANWS